jgi:hypothetical protein
LILAELGDQLREGIDACKQALRGEVLPHEVDTWALWELLSGLSERITDTGDHLLYASLMRHLVATIRLQCEWLRYEADELYVDSDAARGKIASLPLSDLVSMFLRSYHPLMEIEQINNKALTMGREHWRRLGGEHSEDEELPGEFLRYTLDSDAGRSVLNQPQFGELLDSVNSELSQAAGEEGMGYGEFITRQGSSGFEEAVTRGYIVSFLISQGKLEWIEDEEGVRIRPRSGQGNGEIQSLPVIFRKTRGDN